MSGITEEYVERHICKRISKHGETYRVRIRGESETLDTLDLAREYRDRVEKKFRDDRVVIQFGGTPEPTEEEKEEAAAIEVHFSKVLNWFEEEVLADDNDDLAAATLRSYRESVTKFRTYFVEANLKRLLDSFTTRDQASEPRAEPLERRFHVLDAGTAGDEPSELPEEAAWRTQSLQG